MEIARCSRRDPFELELEVNNVDRLCSLSQILLIAICLRDGNGAKYLRFCHLPTDSPINVQCAYAALHFDNPVAS